MENASKALIIVGGVFIGIILLSVMIYIFRQGSKVNENYDQKQITNQLELYNSRFEKFAKEDNNIIDVISLANLAYDTNILCDYDPTLTVEVEIIVGGDTFKIPKDNKLSARNIILNDSNQEISIYDLANLSLKDLTVTSVPQKTGLYSLAYIPHEDWVTIDVDLENDKLSTTKLKAEKTIYKYLFGVIRAKPMEYYHSNGKVSKLILVAYCNPKWKDE